MTDAVKKMVLSVAVNTAIFCAGLVIVEVQRLDIWWAAAAVALLKAAQQALARVSSTGGEEPKRKLA